MEPGMRRCVLELLATIKIIGEEQNLCLVCLAFATASVVEAAVEGGELHHLGDGTNMRADLH